MEKYFTKEGLEKLKAELDYLRKVKQKEVAEAINKAAAFGDLSENAAYRQAKEDLAFLRGRMTELEKTIVNAKIIEEKQEQSQGVQIGSKVEVLNGKEKEIFQIVSPPEADPSLGRVSCQSPIGKALLGKKPREEAEIETPKGKMKYKIISVG